MAGTARQWWQVILNHLLVALLGFLLWWVQDVLQTYRAQMAAVQQGHHQSRRELDDLFFRVKSLEMRVETLRTRRWVPAPKYEDPVD